jgi:hypothetical protein
VDQHWSRRFSIFAEISLQKFITTAVTFLFLVAPIQHSDAESAGTTTRATAAVCSAPHNYATLESAMRKAVRSLLTVALAVTLTSAIPSKAQDDRSSSAVFVMTNAADRNEIISFRRTADGSLQPFRKFATGGRGTGGLTDPLES